MKSSLHARLLQCQEHGIGATISTAKEVFPGARVIGFSEDNQFVTFIADDYLFDSEGGWSDDWADIKTVEAPQSQCVEYVLRVSAIDYVGVNAAALLNLRMSRSFDEVSGIIDDSCLDDTEQL